MGPKGWGPEGVGGPKGWEGPEGSKPTLAKPTLAKVKVLVVCKDFGFLGVNCLGFLKLIVFFVCVEVSWVGGVGPHGPR